MSLSAVPVTVITLVMFCGSTMNSNACPPVSPVLVHVTCAWYLPSVLAFVGVTL